MIGDVVIENFKSITKLELSLGRINVLIGANGCGKSNILEAIVLASLVAEDKLENQFFAPRGSRLPDDPRLLVSAFSADLDPTLVLEASETEPLNNYTRPLRRQVYTDITSPYLSLTIKDGSFEPEEHREAYAYKLNISPKQLPNEPIIPDEIRDPDYMRTLNRLSYARSEYIHDFMIFSPENEILRNFDKEGQIVPLGAKGEGLLKLISVLGGSQFDADKKVIDEVKGELRRLIDWFDDFEFSPTVVFGDRSIRIKDKYFSSQSPEMSQRSSNEGFLFLLFYFCLFISDLTPKFFAVDNIDASLNPKLCARLMVQLTELAKKHDKQAIFTTHNPAVLDGINLDDDEQRLFVVYRNGDGHTTVKRVQKPQPLPGQKPVKLSEAFMRGYIGGLPDNF